MGKKSAEVLAKKLCTSRSSNQILTIETIELLLSLDDETIRQLIMKGRISYHHSGLSSEDRSIIENLYLSGIILILCSTSTLSQGMNLPAHLVIIKGTSSWRGSSTGYVRTKRSDIIQMIGRAGRPGFDEFGVAVVMTSNEEKPFYSDLTDGADIVESNLLTNLTESICSEITLNVIYDVNTAISWFKKTFLFIRLCKNPKYYDFIGVNSIDDVWQIVSDLCIKSIVNLSNNGIVIYDEVTEKVTPKLEAFIMVKNYVKFNTMIEIMSFPKNTSKIQLLIGLSKCEELEKIVRKHEKRFLNDIANKQIKFPIKGKVQLPDQKAFVLLQTGIERITILIIL
mmetsp:Transcript_13206/g.11952  ORF Transcript_13206/g.11952 Transcript_13206/m.11952 type:complete len:340 (-) Transcript_13206:378-1397(-)